MTIQPDMNAGPTPAPGQRVWPVYSVQALFGTEEQTLMRITPGAGFHQPELLLTAVKAAAQAVWDGWQGTRPARLSVAEAEVASRLVFEAHNAPEILEVRPNNGPTTIPQFVNIIGRNFSLVDRVTFGDNDANNVGVTNGQTIVCFTPLSQVAGPVDVTVYSPGSAPVTLPGGFHYFTMPR